MIHRLPTFELPLRAVDPSLRLYLILLVLILPACAPLPTATPPPTPQTLILSRPLALQGWDEKFYACAENFPQLAVFVVESSPGSQSSPSPDILLQLGNLSTPIENTYLLGWEDILLTANTAFPLDEVSLQQLQVLISAPFPDPSVQESSSSPSQFWTYPLGDEARQIFDQTILPAAASSVKALLAPDPSAMLEALANDPTAFGYLPASALSQANAEQQAQVKILKIKETPADFLRQPVVALGATSPSPIVTAYLNCFGAANY